MTAENKNNNQSEFILVIIQYITDYNKHLALKQVLGEGRMGQLQIS